MKRRRVVISGLGLLPLGGVHLAAAQAGRVRTIGWLGANTRAAAGHLTVAFGERMTELGWVEGRNLSMVVRWASGQSTRFRELAVELMAAGVELIVTSGDAAGIAARDAKPGVPVVLASSADPVGAGLVHSLSRPGGSVTGLTASRGDTAGKRLQLLQEMVPGLRLVAVLTNPEANRAELTALRADAPGLGITLAVFDFRRATDLEAIAAHVQRPAVGAMLVLSDPLVFTNRRLINEFALSQRLPTMQGLREYTRDGGLLSYGPDFLAMFRRAADFTDKILRGANPADLPVEQPTRYELVINLGTAKALGLSVPKSLLLRADEVIG
jgi:putative ABC transport system substrate-binding protein